MRYFGMMRRKRRLPPSIVLSRPWQRSGIILLLLSFLSAGIAYERIIDVPLPPNDEDRYHDHAFRVVHVVDGDTVDIDCADGGKPATRVRLWGVDTPEMNHGDDPPMYFAWESKDFARRTLEGKDVHIVLSPKKTRDKFGRLLAYVYLERGGRMFNEMLLEEGYAYADLRFPHHYDDQFEGLERRARRGRVGLWAGITLDNMPGWRQRREREQTVTDR